MKQILRTKLSAHSEYDCLEPFSLRMFLSLLPDLIVLFQGGMVGNRAFMSFGVTDSITSMDPG